MLNVWNIYEDPQNLEPNIRTTKQMSSFEGKPDVRESMAMPCHNAVAPLLAAVEPNLKGSKGVTIFPETLRIFYHVCDILAKRGKESRRLPRQESLTSNS
ncbi:unnamed protein product [Ectocarpus sp. 12 AP-2014]